MRSQENFSNIPQREKESNENNEEKIETKTDQEQELGPIRSQEEIEKEKERFVKLIREKTKPEYKESKEDRDRKIEELKKGIDEVSK